ncbi:MAG: NADH-quinone oxidoreductase subunit A [Deltaproteobacteria bacterium]|jgi:NADH-quinone oxidoreductase subunit A|nr:NADH-quinone oxidoreductase subunit A [Deltaproteobacteria bacterium]
MLNTYVPVLFLIGLAVFFAIFAVGVSYLLGPRRVNAAKASPYECGMITLGPTHQAVPIKYYIIAMLFLVFDLEVVFLYPWAIVFRKLGVFGFVEMMIFVFILLVGFIYVWKKGALEWE